MKKIKIEDIQAYKDFWIIDEDNIKVVFSNAKDNRSFNRNTEVGVANLQSIKKDFNVDSVAYLNQIHSDTIHVYKENEEEEFIKKEGDAIITNHKRVAIGAFSADCVPIILTDSSKQVIASIHSGWKGTINSIVAKTIKKMVVEFGCDVKNIKAYIGPHIRKCCYEISEELKERFIQSFDSIEVDKLFDGRKLSMEKCIESDLIKCNLDENNIYSLNLCTYCSEEPLHSYRKSEGSYGRLFACVFIR